MAVRGYQTYHDLKKNSPEQQDLDEPNIDCDMS